MLVAVKCHSCQLYRIQWLSLVGQLGLLDSGDADIVAVEDIQQFSYFAADFVNVPLHQS